ncbi:universal stress protein [Roseobacter sinensis]|uniref:Universal stress protein n=1 Tax=Roseobacter sinensis TaxID=2931391 RepID=A0ABT3BD60_9RHOB|nr:universal stress protein [Roseobacter sp. WL0113]MCV3271497.1 universal stress protein [Roseobacter sp. WL0113]
MFRQIIVGLDGSEKAKKAARIGCDLAKYYAGTVTLVHVPHAETAAHVVGAIAGYHAAITRPSFAEIEAAGQTILDEGLKIASDVGCKTVTTHMPHGDAATELLAYADEIGADLIVTGRRGLSGVASLVLGSTTQKINHLAKCACLSVV